MSSGSRTTSSKLQNDPDLEDGEIASDEENQREENFESQRDEPSTPIHGQKNEQSFRERDAVRRPPNRPLEPDRKRRKKGEDGDGTGEQVELDLLCMRGASPESAANNSMWANDQNWEKPNDESEVNWNDNDERNDRKRNRNGSPTTGKNSNYRQSGPRDDRNRSQIKQRKVVKRKGNVREVCHNFIKGSCNKGADCFYSHNVAPTRKMELCKFYLKDCCVKRDKCMYMHEEFPCKFFHTGLKCFAGKKCKFSHEPLNNVTKEILSKYFPQHNDLGKETPGDFPRMNRDDALTGPGGPDRGRFQSNEGFNQLQGFDGGGGGGGGDLQNMDRNECDPNDMRNRSNFNQNRRGGNRGFNNQEDFNDNNRRDRFQPRRLNEDYNNVKDEQQSRRGNNEFEAGNRRDDFFQRQNRGGSFEFSPRSGRGAQRREDGSDGTEDSRRRRDEDERRVGGHRGGFGGDDDRDNRRIDDRDGSRHRNFGGRRFGQENGDRNFQDESRNFDFSSDDLGGRHFGRPDRENSRERHFNSNRNECDDQRDRTLNRDQSEPSDHQDRHFGGRHFNRTEHGGPRNRGPERGEQEGNRDRHFGPRDRSFFDDQGPGRPSGQPFEEPGAPLKQQEVVGSRNQSVNPNEDNQRRRSHRSSDDGENFNMQRSSPHNRDTKNIPRLTDHKFFPVPGFESKPSGTTSPYDFEKELAEYKNKKLELQKQRLGDPGEITEDNSLSEDGHHASMQIAQSNDPFPKQESEELPTFTQVYPPFPSEEKKSMDINPVEIVRKKKKKSKRRLEIVEDEEEIIQHKKSKKERKHSKRQPVIVSEEGNGIKVKIKLNRSPPTRPPQSSDDDERPLNYLIKKKTNEEGDETDTESRLVIETSDDVDEKKPKEETKIPSYLPRRQKELFLRIQSHQCENRPPSPPPVEDGSRASGDRTPTPEPADENWYSSDDETVGPIKSPHSKPPEEAEPARSYTPPIPQPKIELAALKDLSKINITELLSSIRQVTANKAPLTEQPQTQTSESQRSPSKDPRVRDSLAAPSDSPRTRRLSEEKPPYAKSIYHLSNTTSLSDTDSDMRCRGDTDERRKDFGDIDFRTLGTPPTLGLPFKPAPIHSAATEIEAGLASHPPIDYKVSPVYVPPPDFTSIKISPNDPQVKKDPRLRRLFRVSSVEESKTEEQPKKPAPAVSTGPIDPRRKHTIAATDTPKSPADSPFSPPTQESTSALPPSILALLQLGLSAASGASDPRLRQLVPQDLEALRKTVANLRPDEVEALRAHVEPEPPIRNNPGQGLLPTPTGMGLLPTPPSFMMNQMIPPLESLMMGPPMVAPLGGMPMGPMGPNMNQPMGPFGFGDGPMNDTDIRMFRGGYKGDRRGGGGRGGWRGNSRDRNWDSRRNRDKGPRQRDKDERRRKSNSPKD